MLRHVERTRGLEPRLLPWKGALEAGGYLVQTRERGGGALLVVTGRTT